MDIPYKMQQIRQTAGLSQKELGEILNTGTRTISDYETGRSTPGIDYIKRFCEHFNISIDDLAETRTKGERTMAKLKKEDLLKDNLDGVLAAAEKATGPAKKNAGKTAKQGETWKRVNLPIEPANHDFIKKLGQASGRNLTEITNTIIKAYRTEHPELLEKVNGLLDFLDEGL